MKDGENTSECAKNSAFMNYSNFWRQTSSKTLTFRITSTSNAFEVLQL